MALRTENMQSVADMGDVVPEGWYHVRVDKVDDTKTSKESGNPMCQLNLKIQSPDNMVGRVITQFPSLQPHALANLKAYYKAAGYNPGPEGHDPEKLLGAEFYVKVDHEVYQGQTRAKVAPWNIKSLQEGITK